MGKGKETSAVIPNTLHVRLRGCSTRTHLDPAAVSLQALDTSFSASLRQVSISVSGLSDMV